MPVRYKIPTPIQIRVRQRARYLCEYCHTAERWQYVLFTIDHIIPINQGGTNTIDNLALACFHCNRYKTNKMVGVDVFINQVVPLFHPRQDDWNEHFIWSSDGIYLNGLTPVGRATIATLKLNRERILLIRGADVIVGRHPPLEDPILAK